MKPRPNPFALGAILGLALLILLSWRAIERERALLARSAPPSAAPLAPPPPAPRAATPPPLLSPRTTPSRDPRLDTLLAALQRGGSRDGEALLTFTNDAARRAFLARLPADLRVLDSIPALASLRLAYSDRASLERALTPFLDDLTQAETNPIVELPATPPPEASRRSPDSLRAGAPLGPNLLAALGITGDNSAFGRGVTIAVLDTGVAPDATFGTGRLRTLDIGLGLAGDRPEDGHATAVAALAAGSDPGARGVAPAADLLSIRVTDTDGLSDLFTVSKAIIAATDAGAQVINISLGGYQGGNVLDLAIDYARDRGAIIIAAAGNDQADRLVWPAADPRVISVGAIDAREQQAASSNSGPQLKLTAPGLGLETAWSGGARVTFDGTSASAPVVAGAIAAVISQGRGATPAEAASILERHANDLGTAGADPDYGYGAVNLGWALARDDATRVDTAIASHHYDAAKGTVEIVLQNRGALGLGGLTLDVEVNGVPTRALINWLEPGASLATSIPIDTRALDAGTSFDLRSVLINPASATDAVPANNQRWSVLRVSPTGP